MPPTLRALSRKFAAQAALADLLEKHAGADRNPYHCRQALDALDRIHDEELRAKLQLLAGVMDALMEGDPVASLETVINVLRSPEVIA